MAKKVLLVTLDENEVMDAIKDKAKTAAGINGCGSARIKVLQQGANGQTEPAHVSVAGAHVEFTFAPPVKGV
jgi:hypothetical protein